MSRGTKIVQFRGKSLKLKLSEEEVFSFLVKLRDTGVTNMWGAAPYISKHLGASPDEAAYWLVTWIKSFEKKPD